MWRRKSARNQGVGFLWNSNREDEGIRVTDCDLYLLHLLNFITSISGTNFDKFDKKDGNREGQDCYRKL